MIQRIQSLYLLLVCILLAIMFYLPLAVFNDGAGSITYMVYKGIVKINPSIWTAISRNFIITTLLLLSLILAVSTIFLYKNRKTQMKLGWSNIIVLLALSIYIFYYYYWIKSHFSIINSNLNIASTFPLISVIFTLLTIRAIKKDDKLVKSMDRIR